MTYTWSSARCVRYNEDFIGEEHPCYWCGQLLTDMLNCKTCSDCYGIFCPHCGKCWCNVGPEELDALKFLRNKYCCRWFNFKGGLKAEDIWLLDLVPGFQLALDYCRKKKGILREVTNGITRI